MIDSYIAIINAPNKKINGEIFNVGFKNQTVFELAENVQEILDDNVKITKVKSNDNRSYHVSCEKIKDILGFQPKKTVKDAVIDLKDAFEKNLLPNSFEDEKYFNIKRMQNINLI